MNRKYGELASRFVHGHILTPEDLLAECASLEQRPKLSGYALSGRISEEEAHLLEDQRIPHGVSFGVLCTKSGALAALVTIQVGTLQIRWFVPLIDEKPRSWLMWSMAHSVLAYLLDVGQGSQVSWCSAPLHYQHRASVEAMLLKWQALDYRAAFEELAMTNAKYAYNDALPTCIPGIGVEQVRLIAVCDGLFAAFREPGDHTH